MTGAGGGVQTKVVGGVTYYSGDGGKTWVNSKGEKLSGGSVGKTIAQPGSKHFGAAPNSYKQIIKLLTSGVFRTKAKAW